ncbi:MAG: hypothetical protein AAFQ43_15300, partial [Bacteroidota bacterium]
MTALPRLLAAACLVFVGCADGETPPPQASGAVPTFRGSFTPVDDGASVPGFSRFRDELREAVARRDTAAFLARVAPGARLSFDDVPGGPEGFREMWFSGDPPDGRDPWRVLEGVLDGGSVEEDDAVTAPFVYGLWPAEPDPLSNVAIVGGDVEAREGPSETSQVMARVGHLIVPVLAPPDDGWRLIRLPDSTAAYVPS